MASSAKGRKRSNDDAENGSAAKKYTKDEISGKIRSGEMEIAAVTNKTAAVWSKFGSPRITGTDTITSGFAVCKCCKIVYKYDSKTGSTPLNQHKCKPTEKQEGLGSFFRKNAASTSKKLPNPDKQQLNRSAILCCAYDMRPMRMFEGDGMLQFCQTLVDIAVRSGGFDVKSELVHRTNLRRTYLSEVYNERKNTVIGQIQSESVDAMSHTIDI